MRSQPLSILLTIAALAGATAAPARAQDSGTAPPRVALADLLDEAQRVNPEIKAAEQRLESARQRPAQAGSLPDPMLEAGYTSSGNPLPGAGLGTEPIANIGVMVSQQIPFPGKRALQAEMASHDAHVEAAQLEAARLSVASRVKQAYFGLAYTYAVADVLQRNRDLLSTLLKVSESRYSVGQAAQQDVIKAQTELSIVELRQQRNDQQRRTREGELSALIGRPAGTPVGRPADLALPPFSESLEGLASAADRSAPMLQRERIMVEHSRVAVELARREYRPDFTVSGGYGYMGSMPPMYEFRVGVNIPLQRKKRAAAVAEQVSALGAARSDYESSRLTLQSRLQEDYQMASTSSRLATLYRDTVLPQAHLALESSMASYQTGTVDFLSVLTNFGTVLEYEMTYFDELSAFHGAVSRLEEMTGTPIVH